MAAEKDRSLEAQDLILLMDHQRNVITGMTVLVEQQKQMIEKQNLSIEKMDKVAEKMDNVVDKMSDQSNTLVTNRSSCSQEHSKIKMRIYLGWIGMIGLIGSIIGCALQYSSKLETLTKSIEIFIGMK